VVFDTDISDSGSCDVVLLSFKYRDLIPFVIVWVAPLYRDVISAAGCSREVALDKYRDLKSTPLLLEVEVMYGDVFSSSSKEPPLK